MKVATMRKKLYQGPSGRLTVLICLLFFAIPSFAEKPRSAKFQLGSRSITYEIFATAQPATPLLILLPGTSGPEASLYRSQAQWFSERSYTVLLLHYFDATDSHSPSSQNYALWADSVEALVRECALDPALKNRKVVAVGYSLGASVLLAAGSQGSTLSAIAEWYGSLPDDFFHSFRSMPPLLILHGLRDNNIPVANAQQLVRLCELRKLTCLSHIYPDQAHGFSDQALEDADRRTIDFFAEHLR